MSFLKKMFGKKDPVEEMRQLHARQDWAGLLSIARTTDSNEFTEEIQREIEGWQREAGDALATINIEEGQWAQKSGNLLRAREDFQLALELASSVGVQQQAQKALDSLERGVQLPDENIAAESPAIHAGCNSCSTTASGPATEHDESDLDEEARMELLLATMPEELAERYLNSGSEFRKAWLLAQDGEDQQALQQLDKVPDAERNALFLYERGALMARNGQHERARQDLQAALTAEPDLFPAFDTLSQVLAATGKIGDLENALKQNLAEKRFSGFCWAQLAELHAHRNEFEPALAAGLKALEEGITDSGLILLCGQLLERFERFDEAEAVLMRLPAGGCGGGAHPMLAEFWLRRGQNHNRALESFKGAFRQERDNPRWLLRIAQVYLAKGWRKEAAEQVEQLMRIGNLPEQIRNEVKEIADQLK